MSIDDRLEIAAPASATAFRQRDFEGRPLVVLVGRITYAVSPGGDVRLHETAAPIRRDDVPNEPHAAPGRAPQSRRASVRYPSDFVFARAGTDVILVGTAVAAAGSDVTFQDVTLQVGDIEKTVRAYGRRAFYSLGGAAEIGPPERFEKVPLLYELAYGGADAEHPQKIERRNPVGIGFSHDARKLANTAAPSLVDPSGDWRTPIGFGAIPSSWAPRAERWGTADELWARDRAPIAPIDCDPEFNSCAAPGLHCATPLDGDEPVVVTGVRADGPWRFHLPAFGLAFSATVRGVERALPTHLDTFLVDADRGAVEITFRASFPAPSKLEMVERLVVSGDRAPPAAWLRRALDRPSARSLV